MRDINEICVNAVEMHKKNPRTFEVPSIRDIENAEYVKICVDNERFWVKVDGMNPDKQTLTGTVDNDLFTDMLSCGDEVTFNYDKVYSTMN